MTSPSYYAIDMGRPAYYSRLKKWHYNPPFEGCMKFEVWGALNPTIREIPENSLDDRLTNLRYWTGWNIIGGTDAWKTNGEWTLLGDLTIITPSGALLQVDMTTEDSIVSLGFAGDVQDGEMYFSKVELWQYQ